MNIAIEEAIKAYQLGEVPVGCIIFDRNTSSIIAKSHNMMQSTNNPNNHAEMLAINEACKNNNNKNLSSCDIYVTLEPCTMCASAISNARIGRLYYGSPDPKFGAIENGVRFYTSSSCFSIPEIYSGIEEKKCKNLMQSFFGEIRKGKI